MFNTLLCAEKMSFLDKLADAGIVVVIGVVLVFLILAFLIGIIYILRYLNDVLNKWDDKMVVYRGNKAKLKAIKEEYIIDKDNKINDIYIALENGDINDSEAKIKIAKIKEEYNALKPEIKAKVAELKEQLSAKSEIKVVAPTTNESVASNDVEDERIIAVITAAIAVATEQECAIRKVKFKVRSIKELK